jgi:hypothetical protein
MSPFPRIDNKRMKSYHLMKVNSTAANTICCAFLAAALLLFTACRTAHGGRAQADELSVAEVHRILYGGDYYEFDAPPPDLRYDPEKSDSDFILYVLQTYSRDSFFILYHFMHELPANMKNNRMVIEDTVAIRTDFMQFADTESRLALAGSIYTIVHECTHSIISTLSRKALKKHSISLYHPAFKYTYRYVEEGNVFSGTLAPFVIYVGGNKCIFCPYTDNVNAVKIHAFYPAHLLENDIHRRRYEIYIHPGTSRAPGAFYDFYTLFDEFHAYYHGSRTIVDMIPYYQNELPQTFATWALFFGHAFSQMLGYYEFKLYLLVYLLMAKQQYPEVYRLITANTQFKKAFREIDERFAQLIADFLEQKMKHIKKWLVSRGFEIEETVWKNQEYIDFTKNGKTQGALHYRPLYNMFTAEMEQPKYRDILHKLAR